MPVAVSKNDIPIRLPDERWEHIVGGHAEMQAHKPQVLETVEEPDFVQEGDYDVLLAVRFYPHTTLTSKYVIVAYRELDDEDGFVLTAYLTSGPSNRRRILWTR